MPPPGVRGFFLSRGPGTCKKNASRSHPEKLLQIQTEIQPHTRAPKGYINGADVLFGDHFFYKLTAAEELSSTGHPTEKKPFELGQKKSRHHRSLVTTGIFWGAGYTPFVSISFSTQA
jgi:hypothetical protein